MPASMIAGRGEAKAMATKQSNQEGVGLPFKQTLHC